MNRLVVGGGVQIQRVHVVFVTPSKMSFDMSSHPDYERNVSTGKPTQTRSSPLQQIPVNFCHVSLDATCSADEVAENLLTVNEAANT